MNDAAHSPESLPPGASLRARRLARRLAVRLGLASLPRGVSWAGVLIVGCSAGIGFTMSLFIGALAFTDASMLATAKLSVLAASACAGIFGLVAGYKFLPRHPSPSIAGTTPAEAERSTIR